MVLSHPAGHKPIVCLYLFRRGDSVTCFRIIDAGMHFHIANAVKDRTIVHGQHLDFELYIHSASEPINENERIAIAKIWYHDNEQQLAL